MLLVAIATLLGASLQSATGFGFALVLGPALFGVLEPEKAPTTLLVLSVALNLLVKFECSSEKPRTAEKVAPSALPGRPV